MKFQVDGKEVFASTGSRKALPDAPSVLFIHGAALDHTVWVLPARYFARKGYNVLAVDLPGHGRSKGTPLSSIQAMADWACKVLDVQGVQQAAIVGHSMGSLIAYCFAVSYPERTRVLALLGTAIPMPVSDMLLDASDTHLDVANKMTNTYSHSSKTGPAANPGSWMLGSGQRLLERADPGVLHTDFNACNAFNADVLQGKVQAPSLVIIGDADQMTAPKRSLNVAKTLPEARIQRLADCGHSMMSEKPNQVLDALADFV